MKKLNIAVNVAFLTLFSGCNFNPNALFGRDPAEPPEAISSGSCSDRYAEYSSVTGAVAAQCTDGTAMQAQVDLDDWLSESPTAEIDGTVDVTVRTVAAGKFPQIAKLEYQRRPHYWYGSSNSWGGSIPLTCDAGTLSADRQRKTFRCKPMRDDSSGNSTYVGYDRYSSSNEYSLRSLQLKSSECGSELVTSVSISSQCGDWSGHPAYENDIQRGVSTRFGWNTRISFPPIFGDSQ